MQIMYLYIYEAGYVSGSLQVCLDKWWLINVERDSKGRRGLGVAGFALRE